jgi:hypothetical protein
MRCDCVYETDHEDDLTRSEFEEDDYFDDNDDIETIDSYS